MRREREREREKDFFFFDKGRTTLYFGSRLRAHLFLRFGKKISFWRISFDQYKGDGVL